MLKLIGATMVVLATTLLGFFFAKKLSDRTEQLRQIQRALQVLETEIYYGSTPLEEAFHKMSHMESGPLTLLFGRCAHYLQELDGATTFECWERALDEARPHLSLHKVEVEWLHHFGQIIGISDREDQQKHLKLLMSHFQKAEKEAVDDQYKHEKMYKTLGVLAGLVIVILMI